MSTNAATGSAAEGGGILSSSALNVTNSTITSNTALGFGAGGGIYMRSDVGSMATITNSFVSNNQAGTIGGGGIYNAVSVTMINSILSGNISQSFGGGIYNNFVGGSLVATGSVISGNMATSGGGIYDGRLTLDMVTISNNSATSGSGGGIYNHSLSSYSPPAAVVKNSAITGNTAPKGGGLYNYDYGTLALTNDTISGNTATTGGGIANNGVVSVTNVTVAFNTSGIATGPGITNQINSATLKNSIISNSTVGANCTGATISGGYNLDSGTSCALAQPTDLSGVDPQLASLTLNAPGSTQTHALLPNSPAIDHGGTSANGCPPTDQRGQLRPFGPACDIGAYEATYVIPPPLPRTVPVPPPDGPVYPAPLPRTSAPAAPPSPVAPLPASRP